MLAQRPSQGSLVVEELLDTGNSSICAHRALPTSLLLQHIQAICPNGSNIR